MVIDTNIFIEYLRAKNKHTTTLYKLSDKPGLCISAVTLYELYMGATNAQREKDIEALTGDLAVLPFTDKVAVKASQIFHELKASNQLIEFRDIFIAATCMVNQLPMATLNRKHFNRIDGLKFTA